MYKKNLISRSYYGDTGYYDNDPLHPEFYEHFVKTTYRTKTYRRKLCIDTNGEKLIQLNFTAYVEFLCRQSVLIALVQKDLQQPEYRREALLLQEKFEHSDCDNFLCIRCGLNEESLVQKRRLELYRNRLYWQLLQQNELLACDMMGGVFSYVTYRAWGDYCKEHQTGEGEILFKVSGYAIFTHMHWAVANGMFFIRNGEYR